MERGAAIVTGAARGIGRATAERLASDGYSIGLLDIDGEALSLVAMSLSASHSCVAEPCDVSDPESVSRALSILTERLGGVSVLVNNAGVGGPFHRIDEVGDDEWARIVHTNARSVFLTCRTVLPRMRDRGHGRVVNVASVQGLLGAALSSTYVASKHAVVGITRALAAEWGAHGITINAVCPGYVETAMGVQDDARPGMRAAILPRIPVGRVAQPEEIAAAVSFLARPGSAYVNGACLVVDGGLSVAR